MSNKTYIHYGNKTFDINKFEKIQNEWSKPIGGLWASPTNTDFGWKDWCKSEDFRECDEENSFKFKLKEGSKVLLVNKLSDVDQYITQDSIYCSMCQNLNFEKMIDDGYDAIELIHGDNYSGLHFSLFNSWDCDSICVFNPDSIEII